jgi:glycerol-3-phosphate dehydrogenase (NAD(P)+)
MSNKDIAIIGDGGWGTTIALLLHSKGYNITLWGAFNNYIKILSSKRENLKFLPGVKLPEGINFTADIEDLKNKDLYVVAVPSQYLRGVLKKFRALSIPRVVSLTKGIEVGSLKRPSEIISELLGNVSIASLSGPSISNETARGIPTTVTIASTDSEFARECQDVFLTERFRAYTSNDLVGVELGGALKNIIAIAAGISDGLGFGTNTKAAILTRGLVEITRLGMAMGASKETFSGLSGLGDLATTCMSRDSRNRWLGEEIGKGKTLKDVLGNTEMVVEGVMTTKSACELSKKHDVEMPITEKIYEVLYREKNPRDAVRELMTRSPKGE